MKCLSCDGPTFEEKISFGTQHPSAIFTRDTIYQIPKSPLTLAACSNPLCTLVQLNEPIDLSEVYANYPYRTSSTLTMSTHLKEVVNFATESTSLSPNDIILDIGGNDGTLLSNFQNSNYSLVNIDISKNLKQVFSSKNLTFLNSAFSASAYFSVKVSSPKLIFCTAVLYQIKEINQFCKELNSIMNSDSKAIIQFAYLGKMYENNVFDNVVHEHITYFSLFSISNLFSKHGLKIVRAEIIDLYGGSLRIEATLSTSLLTTSTEVHKILVNEKENGTNTLSRLKHFGISFESWKSNFINFLNNKGLLNGQLIALGASTKGNMLLQALGLDYKRISYILDNSLEKIGTFTVGTNIPIKKEDFKKNIPANLLVLPYYYADAFSNKIKNYLQPGQNCNLIVPLPEPKIVTIEA